MTERAKTGTVLVVSAWEPELAALRLAVSGAPPARELVLRPVGVGLVEAAIGTVRALEEAAPDAVVFVGTAGLYPGTARGLTIGGAASAARVGLLSAAVARGDGFLPGPLPSALDTDVPLRAALEAAAALPVADVACPLAITTAPDLAARAGAAGYQLENLECFAVGRAAAAAGVPFAAVLGISNHVGPTAHEEWRAHADRASAAACEAVAAFLARD